MWVKKVCLLIFYTEFLKNHQSVGFYEMFFAYFKIIIRLFSFNKLTWWATILYFSYVNPLFHALNETNIIIIFYRLLDNSINILHRILTSTFCFVIKILFSSLKDLDNIYSFSSLYKNLYKCGWSILGRLKKYIFKIIWI